MADRTHPPLDRTTVEHAIAALEERLNVVVTYGAGGCPTCHDAELRGAIVFLRRLLGPAERPASVEATIAAPRRGKR